MRRVARNPHGSLLLPLSLSLCVLALALLGSWGVLRHWRHLTELQLRLDRCVGRSALELKGRLERIESANERIHTLRLAVKAALVAEAFTGPVPVAAARAALSAQVAIQELALWDWRRAQGAWILQRGCDSKGDVMLPYPSPPWLRDPPDPIGAQPLRWEPGRSHRFVLILRHSPRGAAARVSLNDEEISNVPSAKIWSAAWTEPSREERPWPGID